jgi:hypothetical protein
VRVAPFVLLALLLPLAGCGTAPSAATPRSDREKARAADVSILFVGNSHTTFHDLPKLVCDMIRFLHPDRSTYSHVVFVPFLDDAAQNPVCLEEIEQGRWKYVVLQAQRISVSGKHEYSRAEGIDLAKRAAARGAKVLFYAEWGLQGVAGDGPRQEKVYREMAREAGVGVAAPGRAWDLALAERPDLPLYEADGNHQSAVGAFLTAAVLAARLTGESPAPLASFPYPAVGDADREFLVGMALRAIESER